MARDSRRVRKVRRIKLELTKVYKMLDIAFAQRDQARMIASALEQELKKRDQKPALEIKKIDEEAPVNEQ